MSNFELIKSKIYTLSELELAVSRWKLAGESIVFTNGCFDILHLGHVDYLAKASDLGTKLIIGVNTDQSVSKIKGPNRPIQDEKSRTFLLASLACVDAVVLFEEETPLILISKLLPHVLVKGSDYKADEIVGYTEVVSNGGKVETLDFVPGYSTSLIEIKIKRS